MVLLLLRFIAGVMLRLVLRMDDDGFVFWCAHMLGCVGLWKGTIFAILILVNGLSLGLYSFLFYRHNFLILLVHGV